MKRILLVTMIGLFVLAIVSGCSGRNVKVDDSMNGQTINVKNGDTVVISLSGNPTTGYNWYPNNLDTSILSQVGDSEFKADSKLIGAGGKVTLTFKAEAAGTTTLTLDYKRAWEKDVAPIQTFTVTIVVE